MGNAVIDMQKMVEYADFAYQTGLIDIHGHKRLQMMQNKMASLSNDSNAANEVFFSHIKSFRRKQIPRLLLRSFKFKVYLMEKLGE